MPEKNNQISKMENPDLPDEINEVLEGISEPKRKEIERIMVSQISMISRTSPEMEISRKITSEHITAMLSSDDKAMDYSFKEGQQKRIFAIITLALILGAIIVLIILLRNDSETLQKVLIGVISLGAGALGGYGYGSRNSKDE